MNFFQELFRLKKVYTNLSHYNIQKLHIRVQFIGQGYIDFVLTSQTSFLVFFDFLFRLLPLCTDYKNHHV